MTMSGKPSRSTLPHGHPVGTVPGCVGRGNAKGAVPAACCRFRTPEAENEKNRRLERRRQLSHRTVSRVLFLPPVTQGEVAIIHLESPLPTTSSNATRERWASSPLPAWSCSGWGLPCEPRYRGPGALLPHPFTLTSAAALAVFSLWHFPGGRPLRALPGTLPCGARTFLPWTLGLRLASPPAITCSGATHLENYSIEARLHLTSDTGS